MACAGERAIIRRATEEDADLLAATMRAEDQLEVLRGYGYTPREALDFSMKVSRDTSVALRHSGELLCMFGVTPYSTLSDVASPWLLTSTYMSGSPRALLHYTRVVFECWKPQYRVLENYMDAGYTEAVRWAKWTGFTIEEAKPFGPYGYPFHRIEMRRD